MSHRGNKKTHDTIFMTARVIAPEPPLKQPPRVTPPPYRHIGNIRAPTRNVCYKIPIFACGAERRSSRGWETRYRSNIVVSKPVSHLSLLPCIACVFAMYDLVYRRNIFTVWGPLALSLPPPGSRRGRVGREYRTVLPVYP